MKAKSFMLIAGEASGDQLAAELVGALREQVQASSDDLSADVQPLRTALAPRFFGAGGPRMAGAGVELVFDLTQHSVIGLLEVLKEYPKFRRLFRHLFRLAIERQPDVIIGVDYGGFNLRFGRAIKRFVRANRRHFNNWDPKLVQFVSPQVWATRSGRAEKLAEDYDLLLSIFPFEKDWYARRVPGLRVEFVGHPLVGRFLVPRSEVRVPGSAPLALFLPGSRRDEVRRHLPIATGVFEMLRREVPGLRANMVLPDEALVQYVKSRGLPPGLEIHVGGISAALAEADVAITKSGTITMECAMFGVPAVVFYKTSWPTYWIGTQFLNVRSNVKYIAMPNLLAGKEVFPEFIQESATPENIARAGLEFLRDEVRRRAVKSTLAKVIASLGGPGAAERAAAAITRLLP